MAGVSGSYDPFSRSSRFLGGFTLGLLLSAAFLGAILVPTSIAVHLLPGSYRIGLLGAVAVVLATLDLLGRTPYMQRQVPQRLGLDGVPAGTLGIIYGADAGLHVTTQKTTSLIWGGLVGAVLIGGPSTIGATLVAAAIGYGTAVTSATLIGKLLKRDISGWGWSSKSWSRVPQIVSAIVLIIATGATVLSHL